MAGRIFGIQQAVSEGSVQLANFSDLGTKPLGGNRLRLLLHEVNMSSESGTAAIGEEEFQIQVKKHGSVKHIGLLAKQLAKQIARVILMMGLGPTDGILGAAGSFVPDADASESNNEHSSPTIRVCNPRAFHGASFSCACFC